MADTTIIEQIKNLEEEIKKTSYNKATQHHIGLVKAKIARLREKQELRSSKGKKGEGFTVRKSGNATVILIGFPSVGKSTLLNKITNAESKTAGFAFTTLTCIPGLMTYKHAKIQILDVPGILKGAASGVGRGKEVIAVVRNANLVLFVLDIFDAEQQLEVLKSELFTAGLRIDQHPPDVVIKKTARGGIRISTTVKLTKITKETAEAIFKEFKMNNVSAVIRTDIDADQLIDAIKSNRKYLPSLVALNKIDMGSAETTKLLAKKLNAIPISADSGKNIHALKDAIYKKLNFIRVYLKEVNKKPDLEEPMIMRKGDTIKDLCLNIHKDFVPRFKYARAWGKSAKFPGQKKMFRHKLRDRDIVEIHLN